MTIFGEGCYCCLCFNPLREQDAYTQPNGVKIDVHLICAAEEKREGKERGLFSFGEPAEKFPCERLHREWYQKLTIPIKDLGEQFDYFCPVCQEHRQ